jgi:hypothetical protein
MRNIYYIKMNILFLIPLFLIISCSDSDPHKALLEKNYKLLDKILDGGADPNIKNSSGQTLLNYAITINDTNAVKIILYYNVDINQKDSTGKSAFDLALESAPLASGGNVKDPYGIRKKITATENEKALKIFCEVMRSYRKSTHQKIENKGVLSIAFENTGWDASGFQLVALVKLNIQDKNYLVHLSRLETQYVNVGKSSQANDWNILLIPGEQYRVEGFEKDGEIEASFLELQGSTNEKEMTIPLSNYLPTTWNIIKKKMNLK